MNYITRIPPFTAQYSNGQDMQDCVEMSYCAIIYMLTGKLYSPRALAKMVGVDQNGSSTYACNYTSLTHGLIPNELWPTPASFTWDSYYADIPQAVLDKAEFLDITIIDPDLNKSPLWTNLSFHRSSGNVLHLVAQINDTQYFDSEPGGAVKSIGTTQILWQASLKVKNIMRLINDNGTVFLVGEKGKIGIANEPFMNALKTITDMVDGSTAGIPQTKVVESEANVFLIKDN